MALLGIPPPASGSFGLNADVTRSGETGKVEFILTEPGSPIDLAAALDRLSPSSKAIAYLESHAEAFGLAGSRLRLAEPGSAGEGDAILLEQVVGGVPVFAGEFRVGLTPSGDLRFVAGEAAPLAGFDSRPSITEEEAQEAALAAIAEEEDLKASDLEATGEGLRVYAPALLGSPGQPQLTWMFFVASKSGTVAKRTFVNARTGAIAEQLELIHTALDRRVCDAANVRGDKQNCDAQAVLVEGGTYNGTVADVQPMYDYLGDTYTFYTALGRDSIDGAGMPMRATVRYCNNTLRPSPPNPPGTFENPCPLPNASWSPGLDQMHFGEGFAVDDVVGHEVTHGVIQFESNLTYQGESGAINESIADVFGESVDQANGVDTGPATAFRIGEDLGIGQLRSMDNPPAGGHPDKMTSPNWKFWTFDKGGVHSNSGVSNKAWFLMTAGGTFNTFTVTGIGSDKATRIYHEAQVNILGTGSDYGVLANALRQACTSLLGQAGIVPADCTQVEGAIFATEMDTEALAPDTNIDSGPGPGEVVDDPSPTWTFSSPSQNFQSSDNTPDDNNPEKPGLANATYQCSIDQGTPNFVPCSGPGRSHTPASDLADGNYTFRVAGRINPHGDPTPAAREFTVSTADVEVIAFTDSQDPAVAGENLLYTVEVRNNGAGPADDTHVLVSIPPEASFVTGSEPCSSVGAGIVDCSLGTLAANEVRTFTVEVALAPDAVYVNGGPIQLGATAEIESARFDRVSADNSAAQGTLVEAHGDLEALGVDVAGLPADLAVGDSADVTVALRTTNNGPSAPMEALIEVDAAASGPASITPLSHDEGAPLDPGGEHVTEFEATIKCVDIGQATLAFAGQLEPAHVADTDPDLLNNQASVEFEVDCQGVRDVKPDKNNGGNGPDRGTGGPTADADGSLPFTGFAVGLLALIGVGLVAGGGGLRAAASRARKRGDDHSPPAKQAVPVRERRQPAKVHLPPTSDSRRTEAIRNLRPGERLPDWFVAASLLRAVADLGPNLTRVAYEDWRRDRELAGGRPPASAGVIAARLGSWREALKAASIDAEGADATRRLTRRIARLQAQSSDTERREASPT